MSNNNAPYILNRITDLPLELFVAVVTDPDRFLNAKLGNGGVLGGALTTEDLATVTTVML